jgi:dienelactone hydrolase
MRFGNAGSTRPASAMGYGGSRRSASRVGGQDPAHVRFIGDAGRVLLLGSALLLCCVVLEGAPARRVTFRGADGAILTAAYYEASRRPAPGIVLLHMLRRSHNDWDAAASQLSDAGFAVVALDFRGGDDVAAYAADVRAAKAFLRERPEVMPTAIGLAGASIGANVALLDAADDPGVMSVALLSPGLDYRGLRTEAAMKKYGGRSALLIGSTKDPYAARSIRQLITIGPGAREVRLVDTAAHGTALLTREPALIAALVDWFKRTL